MTYEAFVKLAEKPRGKSCKGVRDPLWFGNNDDLAETIAGYSVLDDWMGDEGMTDFVEEFPTKFPSYALLAIIDHEWIMKRKPDYAFDSYSEYFLVVDTSDDQHPVLLWTGEGGFETLADSFTEFYDSLVDA